MPSKEQLLDIIATQAEIARLGLDLNGTMRLVVERTLPLIGADGAAIELAEGDEMVYRAGAGIASGQLGLRLRLEGSLSGLCVKSGQVLYCRDSELDPRVDREACRTVGLRSMIVVPLRHEGEAVGVLKAMSLQPDTFSETDVRALLLLSDVVGAAMYFATKYNVDELFYKATHDAMTGLANRAFYIDRLRSALALHRRDKRPASVLMIDMDGLKHLNDSYGHRVGDAAIMEVARRLTTCARESDTVARLGGDEFGMIFSPVDLPEGGEMLMHRIEDEIARPLQFEGRSYALSASVGMAELPADGLDVDSLLETADRRMYQTKRQHHGETRPGGLPSCA